jgi:glycosyltransferase involved in cell wall biosynthesis
MNSWPPQTGDTAAADGVRGDGPPWSDSAKRLVVYTDDYLDFDGHASPGGRQRHIRDLAVLSRDWGRDVVVVQKARRTFEATCPDGIPVIGLKANLSASGDFSFSGRARRLHRNGDAWLYASGDSAWPYFRANSKAVQHGIWWDGPQPWLTRRVQRIRAVGMMKRTRSVLCVDTNFGNWLRTLGRKGFELTRKCQYVPNYADTTRVQPTTKTANDRLTIVSARRFEQKRGALVLCQALALLKRMGVPFSAHICTVGGCDEIRALIARAGLARDVAVTEETLDGVLDVYRRNHIAIVPTLWSEGTSLACVEAVAAGLPVVCSPVGGLGNLIVPGFNGIITHAEPQSLADAIAGIWRNGDWDRMHQNCLSMRRALGIERWKTQVMAWLQS